MGFRVLLLTRYGRTGASSRLRFLQYLSGLDEYEIVVHPAPFLDDVYLKELYDGRRHALGRVCAFYSERLHYLVKAREFDVVWIEKEVLPWVTGWVARTVLGGLPLVIDFDDAWHLRYSRSPNPLVRWTLGKKLERMASRADFVIVANKLLQSWAEDAGATSVTCIPTVVDLRRYPQTALPAPEPFTIGWIGTPETAALSRHYQGRAEAGPRQGEHAAAPRRRRALLPPASQRRDPVLVGGEGSQSPAAHACRHHAVAARGMGVREVRLQARAIHGGEQAGSRLSGGGELRRGEGGRERLLRYHRGGVGREPRTLSRQYQSHLGARSSGAANC